MNADKALKAWDKIAKTGPGKKMILRLTVECCGVMAAKQKVIFDQWAAGEKEWAAAKQKAPKQDAGQWVLRKRAISHLEGLKQLRIYRRQGIPSPQEMNMMAKKLEVDYANVEKWWQSQLL
jgi:hypothetical protein